MSIPVGTPNHKTVKRLTYIRDNYEMLKKDATVEEIKVFDAIQKLGVYSTVENVRKCADTSRTKAQIIITQYGNPKPSRQLDYTTSLKMSDTSDAPYKFVTDLSGNDWVTRQDVDALIEQHNNSKSEDTPVQVTVMKFYHERNSTRDHINLSVYINNQNGVTLEDMFELLAPGNTIGITL